MNDLLTAAKEARSLATRLREDLALFYYSGQPVGWTASMAMVYAELGKIEKGLGAAIREEEGDTCDEKSES